MFQIFVGVPAFVQLGVATFVILGVLKVYLILTLGVCTSKNKLTGKTVIITGANAGIGKETAIDLAKRGARIIMACRDLKKAVIAKDEIVQESGNGNVVVYELNLASLKSVRKFADEILKNEPRLDVLINNAGCAGIERKLTEDGLEYQMQSNYFGHFLLTNLLLGLMLKTDNARVVNVASDHHAHCKQLNVDDLNFEHDASVGKMSSLFKIYGISKLCNVLFSLELANKLKPLGENNLLKIFYLSQKQCNGIIQWN